MGNAGNETIAAIATGQGGGIGIVRISGPDALAISSRVFRGRGGRPLDAAPPSTLALGAVVDPGSGEPLDEVLAVWMAAGRSYTGEPTVEIQCHGGRAVLESVLEAALDAGARLAAPGEFTRRAFLAGRIDLAQAEAVAELVAAQTGREQRSALSRLRGDVGERVRSLRDRLLESIAAAEALLDHGDEETGAAEPDAAAIEAIAAGARELVAAGERRERCARGPNVVIAGRVNSGKSSIFNVLCDSERSIVSALPGTTRDYIAERSWIDGSLVNLVDTAGLRESEDPIEREGIRRSRARMQEADVLVLVIDGSARPERSDTELIDEYRVRRPLVALSKADLPCQVDRASLERRYPEINVIPLSTQEAGGCGSLIAALSARFQEGDREGEGAAPNCRHREALQVAAGALEASAGLLRRGEPLDLAVAGMRRALDAIGEITGESAAEELLERVFSRFCVGK